MRGAETYTKLRVMEWNVRGLYHRRREVQAMSSQADIVGITETWTRPGDTTENSWVSEQQPAPCNRMGRRQGGVALIINPMYKYTVVARYADEDLQFIATKVADVILICAYLSPTTTVEKSKRIMTVWNTMGNRVLVIGDFNARHRMWDKRTVPMGSSIVSECKRLRWRIWAPKDPTCFSVCGTSVIDLALSKNQPIDFIAVLDGKKYRGSDHAPIYLQYSTNLVQRRIKTRIPISQRLVERYIKKAEMELPRKMQDLRKELDKVLNQNQLEKWYQKLKRVILNYWKEARTSTSPSKLKHNNNTVKKVRQQRSKQYRKAKRTNNIDEQIRYDIVNKEYRRIIKSWRKKCQENKFKRINQTDGVGMIRQIKNMLNEGTKSIHKHQLMTELIPKNFTEYVHTTEEKGFHPDMKQFTVNEDMIEDVKQAITQAPTGKAVGPDEIFVEVLQLFPEIMAKLICDIWAKCGKLVYVLREWRQGILVPIYKRGEKSNPKSYRPITLLSHVRKVIETGIKNSIGRQIKFDKTQTGFTNNMNTETAIIRTTKHIREGRNVIGILDLTNAYNEVPRNKLIDIVDERLSNDTANMIRMWLQPLEIHTRNDTSETTGVQNRGVPQGSPLSPILYNMYMDTYPKHLRERITGENHKWSVDLYADDVKIQTVNSKILQDIMNASEDWAERMEMQWSTKKCKVILNETDNRTVTLAGDDLVRETEVEYLGVTMTNAGITDTKSMSRIILAIRRVDMLKKIHISNNVFTPRRIRSICNTFVYPVASYAIHLVPHSLELVHRWHKLDVSVMSIMFGIHQKRWEMKLRKIGRLPHLHERVGMMLYKLERKLERRMENVADSTGSSDHEALIQYRTQIGSPPNIQYQQLVRNWNNLFHKHRRKIPTDKKHEYIPTMTLMKGEYLNRCIRWYIGTFPYNPTQCIENGGDLAFKAMQTMRRLMEKPEWDQAETTEVKWSIDVLHECEPSSWKKRDRNERDQGEVRMAKKRKEHEN